MAQIRLKGDRFKSLEKAFSEFLLAPLCCQLQKAQTIPERAGPEILQARPEEPSKIAKSLLLPTLLPFLWSLVMRTYSNPSADHGGTRCILLLSKDSNALLVKFSLRATAAFPNTKQLHWLNHSQTKQDRAGAILDPLYQQSLANHRTKNCSYC